ncbi:MAG TPA: hypothetical protein PLB25_04320 [Rhodoferax sp.]|nr:hypothetical protein [Rhodoferax sp.]
MSLAPVVHALTMGELRGPVVIGRTLDVSVQVQAASGDDLAASCFAADVFNADARQGKPKVTVTSATAESAVVRIESAGVVDEPVVSVDLSFNCGFFATRRYVLLTDIESGDLAPKIATVGSVAHRAGSEQSELASGRPKRSPSGDAAPVKQKTVAQRRVAVPERASNAQAGAPKPAASVSAEAVKPVVMRKSPEPATGKAVLKLGPLDDFAARISALESAKLAGPSAEVLLQTQQIASLQADIKALRDIAAKNDAQLLDLKAQLQQARSQQVSLAWTYALGILVLACLAALAWLVLQQRRAGQEIQPKWHDSRELAVQVKPDPVPPPDTINAVVAPPIAANAAPEGIRPPAKPVAEIDINPDIFEHVVKAEPTVLPQSGATNFGNIHNISLEPVLDIRQQAEFFVSLGQTERALQILKKQIASCTEPNPFVYLDLLELFHSLGLKADFREYRSTFNLYFTGAVPDFPAFHLEGDDLLAYPEVLARLVQGWPCAKTLVLLDDWIFRREQIPAQITFDLAAFRDLLMLHALAEEVATDLPWDTVSPEFQPDPVMRPKDKIASVMPTDVRQPRASSLPKEMQDQSIDMDFSDLEIATGFLETSVIWPPEDAPSTRWPQTDRPG